MNEKNLVTDNALSDSIKRINLLEEEELAQFGQNVDDEGNISIPEKKNRKTRRFKLLIALAFVGASIWANYDLDSHQDKDLNEDKIVDVVEAEVDSETETNIIDEALDVSSAEGRLADFSNRYDFQQIETDESSGDHVENLANDEYATNFLLSRAFVDLEQWQALQDETESNINLSEVMTDMYFRRDDLGNPILGVYFNPDVISRAIQNSNSAYFNVSFPVGWVEYNVTLSERRFPELHPYQVNSEEVYSENPNLSLVTTEDGQEVLMEDSFEVVDISQLSEEEHINFLIEEVEILTRDDYQFLVDSGSPVDFITILNDNYDVIQPDSDEFNEGSVEIINESPRFKYGLGQSNDGAPVRNGASTTFNIAVTRQAEVYDAGQAQAIRESGLVVSFDTPRNRQTSSLSEGALFYPGGQEFTVQQNQELLFSLASSNPDSFIVASAGDQGNVIDLDGQPDNLFTIGAFARGMSVQGADFYVDPNDVGVFDGATASAYITGTLKSEDPADPEGFLMSHSSEEDVWRGSGDDSYKETLYRLDL